MNNPEELSVPVHMMPAFEEITVLTNTFCQEHLNQKYADLSIKMAATLANMAPSPLIEGEPRLWACSIIYALGRVNFLFDELSMLQIKPEELARHFGVRTSAVAGTADLIFDIMELKTMQPDWSTGNILERADIRWVQHIDGRLVHLRWAARDVQERAYSEGLIPYIPIYHPSPHPWLEKDIKLPATIFNYPGWGSPISQKNIDVVWKDISITPVEEPLPERAAEFLSEFRKYFVELVVARFRIDGGEHFTWLANRGRWQEFDFLNRFLSHPALADRHPQLATTPDMVAQATFRQETAFTLDGFLAEFLVTGGAYNRFEGPEREAKVLAARFCDAIFGDRFREIVVFWSQGGWSPWFNQITIDMTCIIIDKRFQTITLLCMTDYD